MSEFVQRPVFLKDLSQPFFLKELPAATRDEPPINIEHLTRATGGEPHLKFRVLELFDRHAEIVLVRMRHVGPAGVARLAHTLAGSARKIGARRVAEAAEALARAAGRNREMTSALRMLDCAVIEARLAICAMLRIELSPRRPPSLPSRASEEP